MENEALQLSRNALGPEDPQTQTAMNNLAGIYQWEGRYADAERLYRELIELDKRVRGAEHPDTLITMNNLGELGPEVLLAISREFSRRWNGYSRTRSSAAWHIGTSATMLGREALKRLSERFYSLRYVGLSSLRKTQNQSPQGPRLGGLHGPYIAAESPAPTYCQQRRGGFSLGLALGDRSGCLRNSSATGCSRCPLSPFAGPARRPALRRRGR